MNMMDMQESEPHVEGITGAIQTLQEYQSNPKMITPETIDNVIRMLEDFKTKLSGSQEDTASGSPMHATPYRSDNMKRPNPFQRKTGAY